jgi:hypothetical protein
MFRVYGDIIELDCFFDSLETTDSVIYMISYEFNGNFFCHNLIVLYCTGCA